MSQETIEQTYQVSGEARLKLSNIRGSVDIQVGEDGVIAVTAIKQQVGDVKHTDIEMSQADDGSVQVETRYNEGMWRFFGLSTPAKVDYSVRVPSQCALSVSCVSSSISISGVSGEIKLNSVSGKMELNHLSGPLKINSVSGDVSGEGISGTLKLDSVSGDVNFSASSLPSADASTVSGDVNLETPLMEGPYRFNSVSGDVSLTVPEETCCTAEVKGVSSSLRTTLPITANRRSGGTSTAEIQGGGVAIRLSSVSGSMWIGKAGDDRSAYTSARVAAAPPQPPVPPMPPMPPSPPAPEERLSTAEILAMIERGEMSVDEAIKHLHG